MTEIALEGRLSPPLENGEVVFAAPWQSRIFGIAVGLSEQGHYSWAEFQEYLIAAIGEWDESDTDPYEYYDHFAKALTRLLVDRSLVEQLQLTNLIEEFRQRPHGHDHDH